LRAGADTREKVSMEILLVSHFHWDREWYRTFQAYRARLLDAVDAVLDLLEADPEAHFMLDGQVVLLEDYLVLRPDRRDALARGVRSGRLAIGPWYVQPDSFLPSGESHVRNLLLGRTVGEAFGPVSRVAYVPDSFGHPAQMPQIFAGFGLGPFVYWRGDGDAFEKHGGRYRWIAPDGSEVPALLLRDGYFNAAFLPADVEAAARGLAALAERLGAAGDDPVLLMNGFDHMFPDTHVGAVAAALRKRTGWEVRRTGLDALRDGASPTAAFHGALDGARLANLLPGVWSARLPIKLAARRCETLLEGWLEPWTAAALAYGRGDERPALDAAWRTLLQCEAHDSIGGCATDAVAAQVETRLAEATDLAGQTLDRLLAGMAGLGSGRGVPLQVEQTIAVFNPSPHPRTDVVRIALEDYPALRLPLGEPALGPLTLAVLRGSGFTVDGVPARLVPSEDPSRARWVAGATPLDLEFVAWNVPALGFRQFRLEAAAAMPDEVDDGREIACGDVAVRAEPEGTLAVRLGAAEWTGLCGVEDRGDRGDTYDFEPLAGDPGVELTSVTVTRRRHASDLQTLTVRRVFLVPAALAPDRRARTSERVPLVVEIEAWLGVGCRRVDLTVRIENHLRSPSAPALSERRPRRRVPRSYDVRRGPTHDRGYPASELGACRAGHVFTSGMDRGAGFDGRRPGASRSRSQAGRHDRRHAAARRRLPRALRPRLAATARRAGDAGAWRPAAHYAHGATRAPRRVRPRRRARRGARAPGHDRRRRVAPRRSVAARAAAERAAPVGAQARRARPRLRGARAQSHRRDPRRGARRGRAVSRRRGGAARRGAGRLARGERRADRTLRRPGARAALGPAHPMSLGRNRPNRVRPRHP